MRYIKQWQVPSSTGSGTWTVSLDKNGAYSCSCPRWKFKREDCKHIQDARGGGYDNNMVNKPQIVLGIIEKPVFKQAKNELWVPLVKFGDTNMEATICYTMLKYGYSISEVREIRRRPSSWTADAIKDHIRRHGEAEYPKIERERNNVSDNPHISAIAKDLIR